MSYEKMNDSAKLQFTYGIILLIIAGLLLAGFVCLIWLTVLVHPAFMFLFLTALIFFVLTIGSSIPHFIEAGKFIEKDKIR